MEISKRRAWQIAPQQSTHTKQQYLDLSLLPLLVVAQCLLNLGILLGARVGLIISTETHLGDGRKRVGFRSLDMAGLLYAFAR